MRLPSAVPVTCRVFVQVFIAVSVALPPPDASLLRSTECGDYYYPCERSLDERSQRICIPRSSHCDKKADCPDGEDEEGCGELLCMHTHTWTAT